MPEDRIRGLAAGGDEAHLAHYTTADPVAGTIVRRDEHGFVRGEGIQMLRGLLELGREVSLTFPLTAPPDATFLAHVADGVLDWLPGAGGGEGEGLPVDWAIVYNRPATLTGYGITDAYTQSQINSQRVNDEALMRFVAG